MGAKDQAINADTVPAIMGARTPASGLFERLPEWVLDTLSNEQKDAIHQAADDPEWRRSPVDIRFTVPFFGRKYFFTAVSGAEQRSDERREEERHHYPLRTFANIFFFVGLATLFYVAAVVALALQSAIV